MSSKNSERESASNPLNMSRWSHKAMWRSQVYCLLATLYSATPDDGLASVASGCDLGDLLSSPEQAGELSPAARQGLRLIQDFVATSRTQASERVRPQLAVERMRLLRGADARLTPLACESTYRANDESSRAQIRTTVANAYARAGVDEPTCAHDPVDFIGVELDFLRHLCILEYMSWKRKNRKIALEYLEHEAAFLRDHLIRWAPRLCELICLHARTDFYRGVAKMTRGFVEEEFERIGGWIAQVRLERQKPA